MIIYFRPLSKVSKWAEWNEIDKFFCELSADPYFRNFRRHQLLIQTMDYQGLESFAFSRTLVKIGIKEPSTGRPIKPLFLRNSLNLGHQYKHIKNWSEATGIDIKSINRIVEFGGGYGCMRWLVSALGYNKKYVIIDNDGIKELQYRYLNENLNESNYELTTWEKSLDNLEPKLNSNDLFIALWSLSETPKKLMQYLIDEVRKSNCHILIGYQHDFHGRSNAGFFKSKFANTAYLPVFGLSGNSTSTYIFK